MLVDLGFTAESRIIVFYQQSVFITWSECVETQAEISRQIGDSRQLRLEAQIAQAKSTKSG